MGCREEKDSPSRHFHVIMLRQLPRWQLQELPHTVIPNLFRDPVLILLKDGSSQRLADLLREIPCKVPEQERFRAGSMG